MAGTAVMAVFQQPTHSLLLPFLLLQAAICFTQAAPAHVQQQSGTGQQGRCRQLYVPGGGPQDLSLYECPLVSPLLVVPYLWAPIKLQVKCPSSRFDVYTAEDEASLSDKLARQERLWCGLESVWDQKACMLQVSPFARTLVAIKGVKGCAVTSAAVFSPLMMASGVLGVGLFYSAGWLSSSFAFRISCGSLIFTTGSLLILLILLMRLVPYKKTVVATVAAAGTWGMALARWFTGQWLPSIYQLTHNRFVAVYVVGAALLGAAITYLYDDLRNPKVNTLIKATLRLLGLALVYFSTWTLWPVSATAMGVLLASLAGPSIGKGVQQTGRAVHTAARVTHRVLLTPFSAARRRKPAVAAHVVPTPDGPRPRHHSLAQHPIHALSAGQGAAEEEAGLPAGRSALLGAAEVDRLMPRDVDHLTPLHLRMSPPAPWEVQPKRRVSTFEEQMGRAVARRPRSARKGAAVAGGSAAGGGTPSMVAASAGGTPLGSSGFGQQGELEVSDVVRSGYIQNPLSGRLIKIGGDLYNRLVLEEGYTPDVTAGVLVLREGRRLLASGGAASGSRARRGAG